MYLIKDNVTYDIRGAVVLSFKCNDTNVTELITKTVNLDKGLSSFGNTWDANTIVDIINNVYAPENYHLYIMEFVSRDYGKKKKGRLFFK